MKLEVEGFFRGLGKREGGNKFFIGLAEGGDACYIGFYFGCKVEETGCIEIELDVAVFQVFFVGLIDDLNGLVKVGEDCGIGDESGEFDVGFVWGVLRGGGKEGNEIVEVVEAHVETLL